MEYSPTEDDIRIMREWLSQVPYLPQHIGDEILSTFIKAAKGSLERAKTVFDNFHHGRLKYPEFLKNLDPCSAEQQMFMRNMITVPLPQRNKDGSIIIVCGVENPDPSLFSPLAMYRQIAIILRYYLFVNQLNDGRVEFIYIGEGLTFEHAKKFTPKMVMGILAVLSNSAPLRVRGIHYTTGPGYADWIWNLCKGFLKSKIAQRIHAHKTVSALHASFPRAILPRDLGGEGDTLRNIQDQFSRRLQEFGDRFAEEEKMLEKYDSLRPHADEHLVVGTFRKLAVD